MRRKTVHIQREVIRNKQKLKMSTKTSEKQGQEAKLTWKHMTGNEAIKLCAHKMLYTTSVRQNRCIVCVLSCKDESVEANALSCPLWFFRVAFVTILPEDSEDVIFFLFYTLSNTCCPQKLLHMSPFDKNSFQQILLQIQANG